jgi:hypothetical protein
MSSSLYETLTIKFPFLSVIIYGNEKLELVGIIQNADIITTSFYDINLLKTDEEKKLFLLLGEKWYFESNRLLPINIYLKNEWDQFQHTFKTFITKELVLLCGPSTSLAMLAQKKKRKNVTVIKKL